MPVSRSLARVGCPECGARVECEVEIRDGEVVDVWPTSGEHPHALLHLDWHGAYLEELDEAALDADMDTAWELLGEKPEDHYEIDGEGKRRPLW